MRLLGTALGDEAAARRVLGAALKKAGREALPEAPAALLAFVRAHLVELLTSRLGARVVAGFLDNLASAVIAAEIQALSKPGAAVDRGEDPSGRWTKDEATERWTREVRDGALHIKPAGTRRSSAPRVAVATPEPSAGAPANPRPLAARSGVLPVHSQPIGRPTPSPKARVDSGDPTVAGGRTPSIGARSGAEKRPTSHPQAPAVAIADRPSRPDRGEPRSDPKFDPRPDDPTRVSTPAAASSTPPPVAMPRIAVGQGRANVLVVDTDRYGRSSLSRALVQAGCDVVVVESASDIAGTAGRFHVVIANMASTDVLKTLASLTVRYPDVPCVVRTRDDALIAQHRVQGTGLRNVTVVDGALPFSMLVEQVRKLVSPTNKSYG